jgi:hypothetical protein
MSVGYAIHTHVGAGTLQASTGASTVAVSPNASTRPLDLVVVVCYTAADATLVNDAGDGWVILDSGYDSVNTYGIFIAACIASRNGASGYAGLTLPSSAAYTAQCSTFRILQPFKFDLAVRARSTGWFNATASSTTSSAPAILQPYGQVLDILGRGYNNGGTTTTSGNVTSFTERFDTGQVSPAHGVVLNDRTALVLGTQQNALVSGTLAVAKTNRAGVRAMIGIVGNTTNRGRYMSNRRAGG